MKKIKGFSKKFVVDTFKAMDIYDMISARDYNSVYAELKSYLKTTTIDDFRKEYTEYTKKKNKGTLDDVYFCAYEILVKRGICKELF